MKWHIIFVIIALAVSVTQADFHNFKKPSKSRPSLDPIKSHGLHRDKSHKKRGLFGSIPTFSQGIDIPIVKHSILKPFIVDYPVQSVNLGVKIPLKAPVAHVKYPVPVGHHAPVPYPGYGLQRPSHVHENVVKSVWPVNCAHNNPPVPTVTKTVVSAPPLPVVHNNPVHFAPAAAPAVFTVPAPAAPPAFFSVPAPAFTPVLPLAQPPLPFVTKPIVKPVFHTPVVAQPPLVHAVPQTIIKPGNSVQSSFFATFPKHPFINGPSVAPPIPVNFAHQHIGVVHQPVGIAHQPLGIFHEHVGVAHHPVGVAHHPVGVAHHPVGVAHHPVGIAHHPVGVAHHPVGVAHHPVGVAHHQIGFAHQPAGHIPVHQNVFHTHQQVPINAGQFPINIPQTHIDAGNFPGAVLPTADFPVNTEQVPLENPFNIGNIPVGTLPPTTVSTGNFPLNIGGNIPVNDIPIGVGPSPTNVPLGVGQFPVSDIPIGVGPSPTNVPLGVGQFPIGQNPQFFPRPELPTSGPTFIPTSETGVFPVAQDENNGNGVGVQDFGGVDSNPWIPMSTSATIPFPTPPQFAPESETNFAPTDNTNFNEQNDQNQGYHYQPNSNIPFEEINEQHRYAQQQREQQFSGNYDDQSYRNHFPRRQHLPLRRPSGNFAGYS